MGRFRFRRHKRRGVTYSDYALESFRELGLEKWTIAEIMEINAAELREEVDDVSDIEGRVKGEGNLMWRRAVRKDDKSYLSYEGESDEDDTAASHYVCIYRRATRREIVDYNLEGDALMVVSAMTTEELAVFVQLEGIEF
ncbi:hypothetical protein [Mycolicibacterium septicum]|uniref:hypothetical protein n=1 Tax=Mycolicibacterium septicum TaxID=98668 RepID=UPI00235E36A8|nr:hypothetical protein [Mycolicibacterium septicum]